MDTDLPLGQEYPVFCGDDRGVLTQMHAICPLTGGVGINLLRFSFCCRLRTRKHDTGREERVVK